MKKQRLLFAQIFLLIIVISCAIVVHTIKKNELLEVGTFGSTTGNADFCDLADRFYDILS